MNRLSVVSKAKIAYLQKWADSLDGLKWMGYNPFFRFFKTV